MPLIWYKEAGGLVPIVSEERSPFLEEHHGSGYMVIPHAMIKSTPVEPWEAWAIQNINSVAPITISRVSRAVCK